MSLPGALRILLADDHAILREGLVGLINAQADMAVVGQATNGEEAVRLARELMPDVAILDVSMPVMDGAQATERIRELRPPVRVLALTRHGDQGYLRRLVQAGANGYVLKKSAGDTLVGAIRIVAAGGTYIEPQMAGDLVQDTFGRAKGAAPASELSAREEEVLRAIAWGLSNKEIAANLALSVKTVESYKALAVAKLQLASRGDIVRYAVARGWLSGEETPE